MGIFSILFTVEAKNKEKAIQKTEELIHNIISNNENINNYVEVEVAEA